MSSWAWQAGPHNAGPQIPLAAATGRSVTWRRKGNHEASFTMTVTESGPDDPAEEQAIVAALTSLTPLVSDIWISYRDDNGGTQWLPRLRLGGYQRSGDARKLVTNYGAACYRELLRRRNIPPGKTVAWPTATRPVDAAWTVLAEEQTRPGSNLGIVRGVLPSSATVPTINVAVGDAVGSAIDTIAGLGDAADWDITPTSETGLRFDMWGPGGRGVDRGVVIALGAAAASMPTDNIDPSTYANGLQGTGQAPSSDDPRVVTATTAVTNAQNAQQAADTTLQTAKDAYTADKTNAAKKTAMDEASAVLALRNADVSAAESALKAVQAAPATQTLDATDIASRPEGRWDAVESTDQTTVAALRSRLAVVLGERQTITPSRTIKLVRGWWQGPEHLWLGDVFQYVARVGPLAIQASLSVEEIKADFSKPGDPDVELTFGIPPRSPRYRLLAVDRRLSKLEIRG